ncbi:MAG: tetratricopeptide repeat protein [bacterium]|nr:tetratricopeptide repeat protein [bacterium]
MRYDRTKHTKFLIQAAVFLCVCVSIGETQAQLSPAKTQRVDAMLAESTAAFKSGDLNRAKSILGEVLSIAPRNSAANTLAGIVADSENDLAGAEKHFALAAKIDPNAPVTRNNYGAVLLRLGRPKAAAREFTASLALEPRQTSALVNLAQILLADGNLIRARELFEKANILSPDAEIMRSLVAISLALGEKGRAATEYASYESALKSVQQDTRAGHRGSSRDLALAEALLASGLQAEAVRELESILSAERNVSALILLSKVYLRQKKIIAAGRVLESAVADGVDDARVYLALAEVYEAGGYPENAIPAMRRAIAKEPKNDLYRSRYGLLLINTKAPAAALIRIEEALKEFPDSASLWFALGIAQFDSSKIVEAQRAFEKALSIDPQLVPALAYLGAVFVEQARYNEAAKIYERAIAANEKVGVLHYLLGETLMKLTDADDQRVEAVIKRAIALDPDLTSAHVTLGRLYVRQARWQEAAVRFESAAKLEPDRSETFYQLGRVYARLKRTAESKAALETFKKLNDEQKEQKDLDRRGLIRRLANVRF